jgi:UDP-N-acetylglucosamine 2-epimerase (non-hydrolysing)
MKIATVLGTRPELIRLSKIIPKLDKACEHIFIYTDQSYDDNMAGVFFRELKIREPDYRLGIGGKPFAEQIGYLFTEVDKILDKVKPDRLLVLGDTNSALSAFIAKRRGVRVYHMEAGNRCYSDLVPEEINRRVIDACSDVLMPYTERSRANLTGKDFDGKQIYVTGNPIGEVIAGAPESADILKSLKLKSKKYILATAHRQENVDSPDRLRKLIITCSRMAVEYKMPVLFSRHPRTKKLMEASGIGTEHIIFHEPFGFYDFLTLERNAKCVLTDSGTVQEECCLWGVPCVTLRDNTERPETIECGSNILAGVEPDSVLRCVKVALSKSADWDPPPEYLRTNVSDTVVRILTGI